MPPACHPVLDPGSMVPKAPQGSRLVGLFSCPYHWHMHRTAWPLMFALLLQLLIGSAWAWPGTPSSQSPAHCHESVMQSASADNAHSPAGPSQAGAWHADHHCCAVGLGMAVQPPLPNLPQGTPNSPQYAWVSQNLRPDLRPPI